MRENEDKEENEVYNEINHYRDGRYLSPMETAWGLQQFPLCGKLYSNPISCSYRKSTKTYF